MALGIEHSLKFLGEVKDTLVDGVSLYTAAKSGPFGWAAMLAAVVKVATDVKGLVADAAPTLPELKDVDAVEAGKLAAAGYECVLAVVAALKAA